MAEQVYGNVTIKGFVIGPVVVNDYVLGVVKNADNDYALQIRRGGEEQTIPVVSPMLTTEAIDGGTRVTVEDISGTRSFDILNGKDGIDGKDGANGIDGQDGKDGKDGVSPVVAVTEIENGHRVTITDAEGEKTFDVLNGGGMPEGGAPYQQLVTDGEGKTVWEDRLAYETTEYVDVVEEHTGIVKQLMGGGGFEVPNTLNIAGFVVGQKYIVTWDGTEYESEGKDVEGLPAVEVNPEEDAKVIFGVIPSDPEYVMVATVNIEEGTEHTLRVVAVDNVLKPVDPEYLAAEHGANKVLVTDGEGNAKWEEKPFGEETAVILPETGISKDGADYGIKQKVADSVDLVIGEEYTVVYNGIEVERKYTCSEWSTSLMEGIFIGEFGPMDWEQSSCFGRFALFNDGTMLLGRNAQTGDTIAVYKKSVKKIDPKYLPEGVPFVQAALVGQTVVVKAVDSEGKPTEWEAVEQFSGDYNDLTNKPENPDGLPANPAPYQQLVTDSEGAVVWEDRPFGDTITYPVVADNIEANFVDFRNGVVQSSNYQLFSHNDGFEGDMKYIVTIDGESYTATGSEMERTNVANGNAPAEGEIPIGWASEYLGAGTYDLYFRYYGTAGTHTVTIKYERIDINTLDDKYLSYNIPRRDEVGHLARYYLQNNYNEDWVFVLEDGTEVTKKVSIL